MKKYILAFSVITLIFILTGCVKTTIVEQTSEKSSINVKGFSETTLDEWTSFTPLVQEYFYYRTQAVLQNDIHILWNKYPELKKNVDEERGINTEKYDVALNENKTLLDANFDIEDYEKIKLKKINKNQVVVLVHGSLTYLNQSFNDKNGGEILIEIYLNKKDNKWTVVKTDEYNVYEYKQLLKHKD